MTEARTFSGAVVRRYKISGGYVVRVHACNGQALAYVYARRPMAEATQAKVLTQNEARRIAANIVRLPSLLRSGQFNNADCAVQSIADL